MGLKINLQGQTFGRLAVVSETGVRNQQGAVLWKCTCECGKTICASSVDLRRGSVRSCGCLFLEVAAAKGRARAKHGATGSRTFTIWNGMRGRCNNPENPKYPHYGARGIQVCDRWATFEAFLADMGEAPGGMSIDRINCDGNYEPGNCRWATQVDQQNNRRNNHLVEWDGVELTLADWERRTGISQDTIQQRLKRGWTVARTLSTSSKGPRK